MGARPVPERRDRHAGEGPKSNALWPVSSESVNPVARSLTSLSARRLARFDLGDIAGVVGWRSPCVFVANHRSLFDFVLASILSEHLALDFVTPMQARFFKPPLVRHWLTATGFHPVGGDRPGLDLHGLITRCRRTGESPIITATPRLELASDPVQVEAGFALVARALAAPVVALSIAGTDRVIEPRRRLPRLVTPLRRPEVSVRARLVCEDASDHSRESLRAMAVQALSDLLGPDSGRQSAE